MCEALSQLLLRGGSGSRNIIVFREIGLKVECNERATDALSGDVLGEGAFSTVIRGYENSGRQAYAVKKIFLQSEEFERAYREEVAAFGRFSHPNLMRLIAYQEDIDSVRKCRVSYLLFRLMRASLRDQLNNTVLTTNWSSVCRGTSLRRLQRMLQQFLDICQAFQVLHQADYVHQDVKPENILIDLSRQSEEEDVSLSAGKRVRRSSDSDVEMATGSKGRTRSPTADGDLSSLYGLDKVSGLDWAEGKLLLTDLGSVRPAKIHISSRAVSLRVADEAASFCTLSYRAPELFDPPNGVTLDSRTDVWGLGCLLFAMHYGYSPFECEFSNDERAGTCRTRVVECSYSRVLSKIPKKPDNFCTPEDNRVASLVEWVLEPDFNARPHTADVVQRVQHELDILRNQIE